MSLLEEELRKPTKPAFVGATAAAGRSESEDALADVKVVEFGAYAAGPCISKHLANFGARVIHVESRQRPDGFRLQYPPFKDGKVGLNRSGCFAFFNDSKHGVTLDLKNDEGLKLAYRLVERSEEHTSELQSQSNLVCRLLLEKKKKPMYKIRNEPPHMGEITVAAMDEQVQMRLGMDQPETRRSLLHSYLPLGRTRVCLSLIQS